MKPTLPLLDFSAAAAPTRKDPSCSAKTSWATFSPSESAEASSMIAKETSGLSLAAPPIALA